MAAKPGNTKLNGDYSINIIINNENELRYFYNGVDLQVQIIQGSVLNEIVDVIVTPTGKLLEPIDPDGFEIRKRAGQNIQAELNVYLKTNKKGFVNGDIFPTKSYDLKGSKYLFHVVIDEIKTKKSEDIKKLLENVFLKILTSFEKFEDVNSISLPFIKDVKNDVYSKATLGAIEKYKESNKKRIKSIKIVINEENFKESLRCFREYLKIQPNQQEETTQKNNALSSPAQQNESIVKIHDETDKKFIFGYNPPIDLAIEIRCDDIFNRDADIIVTPTDNQLTLKTALGKKIENKAGDMILIECKKILSGKKIKICPETSVVATESYKMRNFKHVFHAVAPDIHVYQNNQNRYYQLLEETFCNVIKKANKINAKSITMPLINSTSGSPIISSEALYNAILNYIQQIIDFKNSIKCIKIVNNDPKIYNSIVKVFKQKINDLQKAGDRQIEKNSVPQKNEELKKEKTTEKNDYEDDFEDDEPEKPESKSKTEPVEIVSRNNKCLKYKYKSIDLQIEIYEGDLVEQEVDVIVNAANSSLILGSGVAGAIRSKTGYKVQDDCDDYLRHNNIRDLEDGEVMHTKSYMHNCKSIIHAVGPNISNYRRQEKKCYQMLETTFRNLFFHAEEKLKAVSIALPLISSGIFGVPKEVCCERLYKAILYFIEIQKDNPNRNLKFIKIVSIDKSTNLDILDYFKDKINLDKLRENEETKESGNLNGTENKDIASDELKNKATTSTKKDENMKNLLNLQDDTKPLYQKQNSIMEKIGKCSLCGTEGKIKLKLDCKGKCQYCFQCYKNHEQNKQCECKL